MAKTLLTGATGFIGSHLAAALVKRGDELRVTVREDSPLELLEGLDCERVTCDVLDRDGVRKALRGVDRVFHAAGVTSVRPEDAEKLFHVNVHGTKVVLEEALRKGVERVVYTSSAAALGPAPPGSTADESQLFTAAQLGIPYVNSVHEAEVEAMRLAAQGLPLVCVNPAVTFGAGDVHVTSTRLVRSFLLGRVPVYADGAICVVDVQDVARGHLLADRKGERGRALHPRRTQLHLRPPVRRPQPANRCRGSGAAAELAGANGRGRAGGRPHGPLRGARGKPVVDLSQHQGQARARLEGASARGDAGRHRPVAHGARARSHQADTALAEASVPGGGRRARRLRERHGGRLPGLAPGGGADPVKRAFILAGGASRGAYQVGCLKALEEEGITPDLIVGSSIGVCNALLYATGGAEHAWSFWSRANSIPRVFGLSLRNNALLGNSFFSMERLAGHLEAEVDFERCHASETELTFIVANLSEGHEELRGNRTEPDAERFRQFARAGYTIPLLHPLVEIDGDMWADGGFLWNVPFEYAEEWGAEEIYILSVIPSRLQRAESLRTLPQVALRMYDVFWRTFGNSSYLEKHLEEGRYHDIKVTVLEPEPQTGAFDPFGMLNANPAKSKKFLLAGYRDAQQALHGGHPRTGRVKGAVP